MTVQYNGNDMYTLTIGFDAFDMPLETIREIQSFDFDTGKPADTVSELNSKIYDLELDKMDSENLIEELKVKIVDLEEDNGNLKDYIKLLKDKNND